MSTVLLWRVNDPMIWWGRDDQPGYVHSYWNGLAPVVISNVGRDPKLFQPGHVLGLGGDFPYNLCILEWRR